MGKPPYRVFGLQLMACHGVPALVASVIMVVASAAIWETASHLSKPITLDAIWAEPRQITVAEVLAQKPDQGALHIYKAGYWSRLCETTAEQTFIDEQGTITARVLPHTVDVPKSVGPFSSKSRPKGVLIPQELAMKVKFTGKPALFRFRIQNHSECPFTLFPIDGTPVEASFEIVP